MASLLHLHRSSSALGRQQQQLLLRGTSIRRGGSNRSLNPGIMIQKRFFDLHEYQSKELMNKYGVRVQKGRVVASVQEAETVAEWLKCDSPDCDLVVKAQIHAGGRGKGYFNTGFQRGVHVTQDAKAVPEIVRQMLGNNLITAQTGPEGQKVTHVLINEGLDFRYEDECYLAILMDRLHNGPVIVVSRQGGVDIEQVAQKDPSAIVTIPVDIKDGIQTSHTDRVYSTLGLEGSQAEDCAEQVRNLYSLFLATDATQIEINPFVVASDGKMFCLDAKLNFDDSAAYRQKEIHEMRDRSLEDPREVAAEAAGLNYIPLEGNIGCMVNGAGLAMATMDIIKHYGGTPANFLDVGGGATVDQVREAFRIITSDPNVEGLLVNIFGGIMKCDVISTGIVTAARELGLKIPLVVRLEGTSVEEGNRILRESGLHIIPASDLDDAAQKVIRAVQESRPETASQA